MNYGKSLEEVWQWREALSNKLDGLNENEQLRTINENAKQLCKKYNIIYKVKHSKEVHQSSQADPLN